MVYSGLYILQDGMQVAIVSCPFGSLNFDLCVLQGCRLYILRDGMRAAIISRLYRGGRTAFNI